MISDIPHAATHSSLDLFQKPSILVNFENGNVQEVYPTGSLDGPNLEFQFETDRNVFLDMQNIYLDISVQIVKGTGGIPIVYTTGTKDEVFFVNNIMHSLFSNCEVSFNNTLIYTSNGLYAHKALIETEMSHTQGSKESLLYCQGYTYEADPGDSTTAPFAARQELTKNSTVLSLYGRLAIDVFNNDKLLIPNTNLRIKLLRTNAAFCLIGDDPAKNYKVKITRATLHMRQMIVSESVHRSLTLALAKSPARYVYPEMHSKTFIIPDHQNSFVKENIFNNEPIRRLVLAMNTNAKFTGSLGTNPFHYQKFGLREVRISRGGLPLVAMNVENNVRPYYNTIKSISFDQDGPGIPLKDYNNHYILVFDLTSTQQADTEVYYPEVIGAGIRLELFFRTALTSPVELIVLGEKLTTIFIEKDGKVTKDG